MSRVDKSFTYSTTLRDNVLLQKDSHNYIYALGKDQLNAIGNIYVLDFYLSKGNYVEPHYHPNATELTYCLSGKATVAMIDPAMKQLKQYKLKPGEVVSIPKGWWHYAYARANDTHLFVIHDSNDLQTIFGSDVLRLTPASVLANTYCLDESQLKDILKPITETVMIGTPQHCSKYEKEKTYVKKDTTNKGKKRENEGKQEKLLRQEFDVTSRILPYDGDEEERVDSKKPIGNDGNGQSFHDGGRATRSLPSFPKPYHRYPTYYCPRCLRKKKCY